MEKLAIDIFNFSFKYGQTSQICKSIDEATLRHGLRISLLKSFSVST